MNRAEKIQMLLKVKSVVTELVTTIFDEMESELDKNTYQTKTSKAIKASKAKLALRAIRKDTLERVKSLGSGYEQD